MRRASLCLLLGISALPLKPQATKEAVAQQTPEALRLEALQVEANQALAGRQWQTAFPLLKELIELDPSRWSFHQALGTALLNLARYQEAIDACEQGVALCRAELGAGLTKDETTRVKAAMGQMLVSEGNGYLKLGKPQQALLPYTQAAEIDPNPGPAYFNLAATLYNQGQMEAAAAACDKAIAADPRRADAYFIKGSALYGNGNLDARNKYIVPPGTVEALKKYLELAPQGGHAADVKAMLEALDLPIETTFGKKK